MRRALFGGLILLGLAALFCSSSAWALERELGGVRLGAKALNLLTLPGFGQPDFIGPLGVTGGQRVVSPAGAAGRAGQGAAAGPGAVGSGRAGQMRGRRGGGMGPGDFGALPGGSAGMARTPSALDVQLTQGMMGEGGMGMGGGRRGMRAGGAGPAAATGQPRAAQQPAQAQQQGFWLYRRPAGAVLVLTLDPKGTVIAITLNGSVPYPGGRTSKNINLGNDYMEVIRQYGYPDQAVTTGATLQLTYLDHGVRFTLEAMRVNQITIGAYVAATRTGTPVPVTAPQGPTGPGLSIDELKGYM